MSILLLDSYNLLFRSFTSLPRSIVAADGEPINAVYGMIAALLRLMREQQAEHVVAAFDVPDVPTFRHELYPLYQAQRGPMGGEHAADFARQVDIAREILPKIGIPALQVPRFEADDVMATVARSAEVNRRRAIVVSTDRDLLQLVGTHVEVLSPGTPPIHARTAGDVRGRLGVPPDGVTTYKALAGDASDNIPGVRGIGTKTAADLVVRYGSLENIYDHIAELPPRVGRALDAEREAALLFRRIVTLEQDLNLPVDARALPSPTIDADARVGDILDAVGHPRPERGRVAGAE